MVERLGEMRKGRKERIEKGSRERIEIERNEKETKENCSVAIVLDFIQTVWIFDP